MDIKLIALDVDGTLLGSRQEVTPATVAALSRAAQAGIHIVLSTGRILPECELFLPKLPMIRFAILCTGARVQDLNTGELLYSCTIPESETKRLLHLLWDLDVQLQVFDPRDDHPHADQKRLEEGERFCGDLAKTMRLYYLAEENFAAYVERIDCPMIKIHMYFGSSEDQAEAIRRLQGEPYEVVATTTNDLEINPQGSGKDVGLIKLAERLGLSSENIMAIGDGDNDIPMLKIAGLPVAMANGSEGAKACAGYITDDCDHDGVAKAIEKMLNREL